MHTDECAGIDNEVAAWMRLKFDKPAWNGQYPAVHVIMVEFTTCADSLRACE